MPRTLSDSANLIAAPQIDLANAVVLTPTSYASWSACLAANSTKLDFLLTPGSYAHWGSITITNKSGTSGRHKTFRYYDVSGTTDMSLSAYERNVAYGTSGEAIIDGVYLNHITNPSSYWQFIGLTARLPNASWIVSKLCTGITFSRCHIDGLDNNYGVRLFGNSCTVQQSVIRNAVDPMNAIGVQFKPLDSVNITGGQVLDCEIYNVADCVIFQDDADNPDDTTVEALIDGNDFYTDLQSVDSLGNLNGYGLCENAIDIKAPGGGAGIRIKNNRMWGFRRNNVSAVGDAIICHQHSKNITIGGDTAAEGNIIQDCPSGVREEVWPVSFTTDRLPRNIVIKNNFFGDIDIFASGDYGSCVRFATNGTATNNTVGRTTCFLGPPPASGGYGDTDPVLTGNTLVGDVDALSAGYGESYRDVWVDASNTFAAEQGDWDTYQRKRWTGVETVDNVVPLTAYATVSHRRAPTTLPTTGLGTVSHRGAVEEE
jgi:hypothetical protein